MAVLNQEQAKDLQKVIDNDVQGTSIVTRYCEHFRAADGAFSCAWVAIYFENDLLFTVSGEDQWTSIYRAFDTLFSGPSAAEIDAMEKAFNRQ